MQTILPSHIALPAETRSALCHVLDTVLANTLDLHSQVKHAHWNVKGPSFIARHELFDAIAERLRLSADVVAERAAALGGRPGGTARSVAATSQLEDYPMDTLDGNGHIQALISRLTAYCAGNREAIRFCADAGDPPTEDLLTRMLADSEKELWMLESHRNA